MPGPNFAALAIGATAAVDAVMAEPWAYQPMMEPADKTAGDVADLSRIATTVVASFLDRSAKPNLPDSYDTRQQRRPGLESGTPRLWISPAEAAAQLAANPSFDVRAADQFRRESDGRTWRVSSVEPTAGGAFRCSINLVR